MTEYDVHPVADLFPMLADDELEELAADIKVRGQLQPIVLDAEGRILDGRNRLAACRLAGVEPKFDYYTGDDPDGFAWSVNVKRRSLTKAQVAVMAADRFADKNLSTRDIAEEAGVSQPMIVWAQAVRRYPDLRSAVLDRSKALNTAYDEATKRDAAEADRQAKLSRLREAAPDLLALVEDERVSLGEALAALDAREAEAKANAELAERVAKLPADLAERVNARTLDIDEAESVVEQRADRLRSWAEKVSAALETIARMAGNPVPADLKEYLTDREIEQLGAVLGALRP